MGPLVRILMIPMAVWLVLTAGSTVLACDCVTRSPAESFQDAEVVFEGVVIRKNQASTETTYTFRVTKLFKGSPESELTLIQGTSDCDATFLPDTVYRVYARSFSGHLNSGACSGNEVLGFIRQKKDSELISTSLVFNLIPLAALCLVVIVVWLLARRRK
jgi:hypothetical protein